ncbi:NAD-binding protein [Sulfurospirillum sp. 1612]|uniref:NAD-binding protein n=1 Tax=Sulfurospirillum sp. 1612 TaxID=3094835 RepID=UPI002F953D1E
MKKAVIFGYTKTGREIAKLLQEDEYEFQIIDDDALLVHEAKKAGYDAWHSNVSDDQSLEMIGIGKDVAILFCTSDNDSMNLFVTLSARNLDKNLKILTLIKKEQDSKKMLLAGANRTISPHSVGAMKAFRIIDKPKISKVLNRFSLLKNKLAMSEFEVLKGSIFDGASFKDLKIFEESNLIFLGILDHSLKGAFIFHSQKATHKIHHDDVLLLLGSKENIKKFRIKIGAV